MTLLVCRNTTRTIHGDVDSIDHGDGDEVDVAHRRHFLSGVSASVVLGRHQRNELVEGRASAFRRFPRRQATATGS
jgi:hypothetical protein